MISKSTHLSRITAIGILILLFSSISFTIGFFIGRSNKGIPFVGTKDYIWSIGIYMGNSPFDLTSPKHCDNPVLTASDVSDVPADFVADPFMVHEGDAWYMFFEVLNLHTQHGDIGLASSTNGFKWTYQQIVLDEPFHLSYPCVFEWNEEYYMIPESAEAQEIRLYKATTFPLKWTFIKTLMEGDFIDPSIFYFKDKWWMFAEINPKGSDTLGLYYADNLTGPWLAHPRNPIIVGNANIARPGGRVILFNECVIRFTQDCKPIYGNQVRAFEVTELTTTTYEEREVVTNPILTPTGSGWNAKGMHHLDPHQMENNKWIACVDGFKESLVIGLNY